MNLLSLILLLIVIGVVLYLVNRFIPMDQAIKTILNVVIVVVIIIWLIEALFPGLGTIQLGPVRRGP
jgi:hypothetical protein